MIELEFTESMCEHAISYINSDDREMWLSIGMGIRDHFGDGGFQMWADWSSDSLKFNRKSCAATWKSFKKSGITIGTVIKLAQEQGYVLEKSEPISFELAEKRRMLRQLEEVYTMEVTAEAQAYAAKQANDIMQTCRFTTNDYLATKGFPDAKFTTMMDGEILAIPMFYSKEIVGVQKVYPLGRKEFLTGQKVVGTQYRFGNESARNHIVCEGFATGLTAWELLKDVDLCVHVCFTAYNACQMAKVMTKGLFIADNDESKTGEKYAKESGMRYWMPDTVGFDLNDEYLASTNKIQLKMKMRGALRG